MNARIAKALGLCLLLVATLGARRTTPNFVVETADPQFCERMAQAAETYRRDLAIEWLGTAMPDWSAPCVMTVTAAPNLGAGGATTFVFDRGEVFGWRMSIQGSQERLLDSVLPHEVTHMIFASHFRRPVPRWADEGGATSVEHPQEKNKHRRMLVQFLQTGRGIAFSQMFAMTEYPRDVMPLYAQGFSLTDYLIQQGGRRRFVAFLEAGMRDNQWAAALQQHYGLSDLGVTQNQWLAWVSKGFPNLQAPAPTAVASASSARTTLASATLSARPEPNLILRLDKNGTAMAARPHTPAAGVAQAASAAGWQPLGSGADAAGTTMPVRAQVTHPQPMMSAQ